MRRPPFLRRFPAATTLLATALVALTTACGGDGDATAPADEAGTAGAPGAATTAALPEAGGLTLQGETFRPGEPIPVAYRLEQPAAGSTWVGLIPAEVESSDEAANDAADVTYAYVPEGSSSGTLTIAGQAPPGRYRLRLFAGDDAGSGMLSETAVFEVRPWEWPEGQGVRLSLSATKLAAGEELRVTFEIPEALPDQAWLAVVPATVTGLGEPENDAEDVAYQYVRGTSGEIGFPDLAAGEYVVRLFPCDGSACGAIAQVGPLTVE